MEIFNYLQTTKRYNYMKKHITFTLHLDNPSDRAVEEVTKATDEFMDTLEYLLPKATLEIDYLKN